MEPTLPSRLQWWLAHPGAFFWRVAGKVYRQFHPDEPWLSLGAIRYLQDAINNKMMGLEWGSGRSTAWFAARLGKLVSVEHNPSWHTFVSSQLKQNNINNVDYRMVPLDHPVDAPTPAHYPVLPRYVAVANDFPNKHFDFILIDGHYRQACVLAALPKLKSGGLLTIDNSNWIPITEWGVPGNWPMVHRSYGFDSETTIWKKP